MLRRTGRGRRTRVPSLHATGGTAAAMGLRVAQAGAAMPRWVSAVLLAALLAVVWFVVCTAGGSATAMPHLFYLPILASALAFSVRGAVLTAVVAAVLAGPLMPDAPEPVASWLFRGLMFVVVAVMAAVLLALHGRMQEERTSQELAATITGSGRRPDGDDDALVRQVAAVLRDSRFHPVFQPIYSLKDGSLVGVEALTRFDVEPSRPPDLWFAAAQRSGHGPALETAAIAAALGCVRGLPSTVRLCLNASPGTLAHPALQTLLRGSTGVTMTLELTEHDVIDCYEALHRRLAPLRDSGIDVAVDDAGAGFSSLQHIVQLSPDVIKLDASLTTNIDSSPVRRALGRSLVEFVHSTGAQLVVEGIEREADLLLWAELGADAAQGYLLGCPGTLPAAPTNSLIRSLLVA